MNVSNQLKRILALDALILGLIALVQWWVERWSVFALGLFGFVALFVANFIWVRLTSGRTDYQGFAMGGAIASLAGCVCFIFGFIQAYLVLNNTYADGIGEGLAMFFGLGGAILTGLIGFAFWRYAQD